MLFKALGDLVWGKDAEAGHLRAVFSTFNTPDHDGDVTLPSAFTDGQPVPMVWSHDWSRPVGKGTIEVKKDRAVFAGSFFLQTPSGAEAYEIVKAMGDLQEYSYGYAPLEAEPGVHDGQPVRFLKKLQVFEVSPVLVGAGVGTGTERIKAAEPEPDPADPLESFVDHGDRVLGAVTDYLARAQKIAALRAEDGRPLSANKRAKLTTLLEALAAVRGDVEELLRTPAPGAGDTDLDALFDRFRQLQARHGGR